MNKWWCPRQEMLQQQVLLLQQACKSLTLSTFWCTPHRDVDAAWLRLRNWQTLKSRNRQWKLKALRVWRQSKLIYGPKPTAEISKTYWFRYYSWNTQPNDSSPKGQLTFKGVIDGSPAAGWHIIGRWRSVFSQKKMMGDDRQLSLKMAISFHQLLAVTRGVFQPNMPGLVIDNGLNQLLLHWG